MLRVLSAAALLVVVAAGCGGADRPQQSATYEVPRALARSWEGRAAAIANAASAGKDCRARQLAVSLRDEVVKSQHELPLRLRSPLLTGVTSLAARITCTPPVTSEAQKPPKPPHERHGHHEHHGHHRHGKDGGGEDK